MNILRFIIPKSQVVCLSDKSTVRQALEKMRFHRYQAIPVLDGEGRYVGTLRNDDLFKYFLDEGAFDARLAEDDKILDILDRKYSSPLSHAASMDELFELVTEHNFVPVVDDRGCFIGIILRRTVMDFLRGFYKEPEGSQII